MTTESPTAHITFLGHATVALTAGDGTVLVVDPYEPGGFGGKMRYRPIAELVAKVDGVVTSHGHADHAYLDGVEGAEHVSAGTWGPFTITRVPCAHDEYGGRRLGGMVDILLIEVDDMRVVHLSDAGQSPTPAMVDSLRGCDVLLVPTGGFYTIGAFQADAWISRLNPRVTIPIHFATSACDLPIRGLDPFRRTYVSSLERRSQPHGAIGLREAAETGGVITLTPRGEAQA